MAEDQAAARPTVSVVFITYNRPDLCRGAVQAVREYCKGENWELVITDDGSASQNVEELRGLPVDRILTSPANTGLGANTNRGLRAAIGKYILHHQDDWRCRSSEPFVAWSIENPKTAPRGRASEIATRCALSATRGTSDFLMGSRIRSSISIPRRRESGSICIRIIPT